MKGLPTFTGRPGESLPPLDLDATMDMLKTKYDNKVDETDLMSYVM